MEEDPHQADPETINIDVPYQPDPFPFNRFERFSIEGHNEPPLSQADIEYFTLIPSSKEDAIMEEQNPGDPNIQESNGVIEARQQPGRITNDYDNNLIPADIYENWLANNMIPADIYRNWLADASDIVSREGRRRKKISNSKRIAELMKLPPVVLGCKLYSIENKEVYYPAPLLDLWAKSNQPPHNSPSARGSAPHHPREPSHPLPPEPSYSSPPGGHYGDFTGIVSASPISSSSGSGSSQPNNKATDFIKGHMKAHFEIPGARQVESLDFFAAGMNRKSAAKLFYQTLVLASRDDLKVGQEVPYGEILISRGSKM